MRVQNKEEGCGAVPERGNGKRDPLRHRFKEDCGRQAVGAVQQGRSRDGKKPRVSGAGSQIKDKTVYQINVYGVVLPCGFKTPDF